MGHLRARYEGVGGFLTIAGAARRAPRPATPTEPRRLWLLAAVALTLPADPAPALGTQWVEPPGTGWLDVRHYHHDTREEFGPDGERQEFFARGHAITRSTYLTLAAGVVRGVDVWAQLPFHIFSFDDTAGERDRAGFGDPRLYLRAGPSLFGVSTFPIAVRGGVKLPVAEFPVDAEIIPLTEGQVDWELYLELGWSFHPVPVYGMGWVGHRWREAKGVIRDPGDERLAYVAFGGDIGSRLTWKLAGEGLWGLTPVLDRVAVANARRKMIQVFPTLGFRVGPGTIEVGGRIPLEGRNLPAGPALVGGYHVDWSLRER